MTALLPARSGSVSTTDSAQLPPDLSRPLAALLATAHRHATSPDDWPVAPRFNPRRRWYTRIAEESDTEIWLLTWLPGQHTKLHDHGGSSGAFVVCSGTLTEHSLADDARPGHGPAEGQGIHRLAERALAQGRGRSFGPGHVHQIINTGTQPAVSVHAYSPALQEMTHYELEGGHLLRLGIDRARADW